MAVSFQNATLLIDSREDPAAIRRVLESYAPWRHKIDFSCGISTTDFKKKQLLNNTPLSKIMRLEELTGPFTPYKRAMDVGSNAGYNSIYLAEKYGMQVLGIDFWDRHVEVSRWLTRTAGTARCKFKQANSETYVDGTDFDLILHLGTLYHLRNPVLALEAALSNLRPGGMMLIETQVYGTPDETRAAYIHNLHGDVTNFWALGQAALLDILATLGADAEVIGDRYALPVPDQYRIFVKAVKRADSPAVRKPRWQRGLQALFGGDRTGLRFGPADE